MKRVVIVVFLVLCVVTVHAAPKLVPKPVKYEAAPGQFVLNADTRIVYGEVGQPQAELLALLLRPATGYPLLVEKSGNSANERNAIVLSRTSDTNLHEEGYALRVSEERVELAAKDGVGLAHAVQTLRQLLPPAVFSSSKQSTTWAITGCTITDHPGFKWRGMMLDVSRYWYSKEFMLRYLDMMAMHKMNVLHWHIVDDAGWRVEIKKYPKLTEVGAFRGTGESRYGGFYTQEDVREIVRHATNRGITIVPEIEIPAHTLAAVVAYPYLSCHGRELKMPTRHFISKDLYCPGKATTWTFLEDVMTEINDLFPGTYIHIGGDEASYRNWEKCKDCQALMKKEGIEDTHALHGYMNLRIEKFLQGKGRQIIGWDEILKCGISEQAGVMIWRNKGAAVKAAERGNLVVMALTGNCYFDTVESKHPSEPPGAGWIPPVTLMKAYSWHPVLSTIKGDAVTNVGGGNGCVWSDQFLHQPNILPDRPGEGTRRSEAYIEYLSLPRMAALSEVNWTPREQRDWDDFQERMKDTYVRYINAGYNFRLPLPELTLDAQDDGRTMVTAKGHITGGKVRFVLDGSNPTIDSPALEGTILVKDMATFRAATFSAAGKHQSFVTMNLELPEWIRRKGAKVGHWRSSELSADPKVHTFDATGIVTADGTMSMTFLQTEGKNSVTVHRVELVRNDVDVVFAPQKFKPIVVPNDKRGSYYRIGVRGYETGASFKFKVTMSAKDGTDSDGYILLRSGK
ncbi:MAG: family 20 glycosylhydrolase [Kiritimatiellia bacterium]|jgi:hexosaminidase|nr:family 20 glycosylhydrolase [Kiritimatiellia bacterium]